MTKLFEPPPLPMRTILADADHFGGTRSTPQVIILHATQGTDSLKWLTTDSNPPVSIHRLIDKKGTITQIVPDDANAWHAGFGMIGGIGRGQPVNLNMVSFGIELENLNDGKDPYPVVQVNACAVVIVNWWATYGFLPVLSHAQVDTRKTDPKGFDWSLLWRLCARQLQYGVRSNLQKAQAAVAAAFTSIGD